MMRLMNALVTLLTLVSFSVSAGTIVTLQSNTGQPTKVMMEGGKSRIDTGGQDYVLIDYDKKTMFVVVPEKKQIMDMTGDVPSMGGKPAPKLNLSIASQGAGPQIAGYATEKFTLKANGSFCGTVFGSKKAMQTTGIDKLFDSMKSMADKQRAAMGGYASLVDDCTRANMNFASQGDKIGVPMKVLDKNGKTANEIKSIVVNATVPANAFVLPKGYQTVKINDMLKGARQKMSEHQRNMPDMQNMMQQMQQSGRMTPEALEQMKRYQKMMQQ